MLAKEAGTDDELVVERGCQDTRFSTHRGVDFQVRMSYTLRGGILADDMGYGKTLLTICTIAASCRLLLLGRKGKPPCGTTLIFVPENLVYQWLREFKKALGEAVHTCLIGAAQDARESSREGNTNSTVESDSDKGTEESQAKVYAITSIDHWAELMQAAWHDAMAVIIPYSLLRNVEPWFCLHHYHWRRVVVDELHEALSSRSNADALGLISAQHFWGLSATLSASSTGDVAAVSALFGVSIPIDATNAGRFLDCYVRRNASMHAEAVPLSDNRYVVRPTVMERAIYLACQHDFDDSKASSDYAPDGYVPAFLSTWRGLQEHGREAALVKLCCHHQLTDTDMELLSTPAQSVERLHMWKRHHCKEARRLVKQHALLAAWMARNCKNSDSEEVARPCKLLTLPECPRIIVTASDQEAWAAATTEVDCANALDDEALLAACSADLEAIPFAVCDRPKEAAKRWLEWCDAAGLSPGTRSAISRLRKIMYDELWGRLVDGQEGWAALSKMPGRDWQADHAAAHLSRLLESVADYASSLRSIGFLEKVMQQAAASELECGICLHTVRDARITPCAHIFCGGCILRSLKEKAECPQCRSPVRSDRQLNVLHSTQTGADCNTAQLPGIATASSSSSSSIPTSRADALDVAICGGTFGSKITALIAQLEGIRQLNEKAVVFAQWQDLIFKIHAALIKSGIHAAVLAGSAFDRASVLQRFEGPELGVLLLSLEDSASGTNMAHANHVVLVHPMVAGSAEEEEAYEAQAVGRVRRWGQKRKVQVWRFVVEGTIEADLAARHVSPVTPPEDLTNSVDLEDNIQIEPRSPSLHRLEAAAPVVAEEVNSATREPLRETTS
jgi:superfamily II DNA or RNA helicase